MIAADELYMQRALDLALLGKGAVRPNPMVGCVIVHNGTVTGEGWHRQYGGPHAEVNAIAAVADKSLLPESTVYVTLEPCSHFGKTPPCADLLIKEGIKEVVICNLDPNPLVAGRGITKLEEAGIEVTTGVMEANGLAINKRFFTFHRQKRPYVVLKWAETADRFIAGPECQRVKISGDMAGMAVHQWRTEEQAIMVGTRTAVFDNPKLNIRNWTGQNPVRVVLDKNLVIPATHHLFDKSQPTLIYNRQRNHLEENLELVKIDLGQNALPAVLADLYSRNIQSVLVEGGTYLLNQFLQSGLWDEARIFRSKNLLKNGIKGPDFTFANPLHTQKLGPDTLYWFKNLNQ